MKKNAYLMAALIGMGGIAWGGCSEDEKIVEVEKIIVEQDITKISEAAREGIKGNPKTITEYITYRIDETADGVTPGEWKDKIVISYNEAGYIAKMEEYTVFYKDADVASDDPAWITLKNKELMLIGSEIYTLNTDNKCTGILEESKELRTYLISSENESAEIWPYLLSDQPFEFGYELGMSGDFGRIEIKMMSSMQKVTTIESGKAIRITQSKEEGESAWTDIQKEVLDLDEFGYPNESSKEIFNVAQTPEMKTRAFATEPTTKYVEKLDDKGNWIIRYILSDGERQYIKRDIVYY